MGTALHGDDAFGATLACQHDMQEADGTSAQNSYCFAARDADQILTIDDAGQGLGQCCRVG